MNIQSSSYNPYASGGGMGMQRTPQKIPDKSELEKLGQDFFSQLDSQQKGYLEQSDFASCLSANGSTDTGVELFSAMDANADGQLTQDEFSSAFSDILYNQQGMMGNMPPPPDQQGDMPPPPPPPPQGDMTMGGMGMQKDTGKTADEISSLIDEINQFDPAKASELQNVLDNFDEADNNADGKITMDEIKAFSQTGQTSDAGKTQEELSSLLSDLSQFDPGAAQGLQTQIDNFASADTDGDGKMSSTEAQTFQQSMQQTQNATTDLNKQLQKLIARYTMDFSQSLNSSSLSVNA